MDVTARGRGWRRAAEEALWIAAVAVMIACALLAAGGGRKFIYIDF